jgi:hypothetical protein
MPELLKNTSPNNESQRADWQRNHTAIHQCIVDSLKSDKRMPTFLEMEVATGLHETTIRQHAKSLDICNLRDRSRLLAEGILVRQAERAYASGEHNAAKTFAKLNFDWTEKSETNLTGAEGAPLGIQIYLPEKRPV